jgi:diamine N-acetyltransferase
VLRLEEITEDNLDDAIAVTVRHDQEHLVAPVVKSLAEAYVHPTIAWPRLIRDGSRPVGFLMGFYLALGFRTTGALSGGQTVGELRLT